MPYVHYPIYWYGVFFALGFFVSYQAFKYIMSAHLGEPRPIVDRIMGVNVTWLTLASIVGARLAYVFCYGWPYYRTHLLSVFDLRAGGLASHGAVLGILVTLGLLARHWRTRYPKLSHLVLFDMASIACGFAAASIRIGNFFNQEITGTPTTKPWGVQFMHPQDGMGGIVHPVQLYEALTYLALAVALMILWRRSRHLVGTGLFTGILLTVLFIGRFVLEYFKVRQGDVLDATFPLTMGQLLSLPMIGVGLAFLGYCYQRMKRGRFSAF